MGSSQEELANIVGSSSGLSAVTTVEGAVNLFKQTLQEITCEECSYFGHKAEECFLYAIEEFVKKLAEDNEEAESDQLEVGSDFAPQ